MLPFCKQMLFSFLALSTLFTIGTMCIASAPPQIISVEPPSWWAGHSLGTVRLLIHGRNLQNARLHVAGQGITVHNLRINTRGTYLFADADIAETAKPGTRRLHVSTDHGETDTSFEILPPLPRAGRFAGLTPNDVIYLIMPDRFSDGDPSNNDPAQSPGLYSRAKTRYYHGGDFEGIINHLPYLKRLGVTALWLTPIYDNADKADPSVHWDNQPGIDYHGYGAVNFYRVEEHFGDLERLRALVNAAHRLDIKVIQDQVANHTGPFHPWVSDSPTPTWFHGTGQKHPANVWQTWSVMDPYATPQTRHGTLDGWFADVLPDLNQDDPEVARYIIQNALWWVGIAGFDAIRQDTLSYVPRHFWKQWSAALKRQFPKLTIIGEVNGDDPALVSYAQGGRTGMDGIDTGIDTLFDYPLYFAMRHAFAEGKPLSLVPAMLAHDFMYPHPERLVTFIDLHDVTRFMSVPGANLKNYSLALTFLLTTRGIPMLYYGDEIALPGGDDPDNRRDFPGGFPSDTRNAFLEQDRTPEEQAIFDYVQTLTHLRAQLEPLRRGTLLNLYVTDQQYIYARRSRQGIVLIALNTSHQPTTVHFSVSAAGLHNGQMLQDRLKVIPDTVISNNQVKLKLPAQGTGIFTVLERK